MIPKLNNSLRNGTAQDPQDQRRKGRAAARPESCSLCFSTFEVILHHEFAPEGQTVNAEFYCSVLCRLRDWDQCVAAQGDNDQTKIKLIHSGL
jgi:hypothetical protein